MSVETSQSTKTLEERERKGQRPTHPAENNKKKSGVCGVSFWRRSPEALQSCTVESIRQHGRMFWLRWVGILYTWQRTRASRSNAPTKRAQLFTKISPLSVKNLRFQKSSLTEQGWNAKPKLNRWFIDVRHVLKRNSCLMIIMALWGA